MSKLKVYSMQGAELGEADVPDALLVLKRGSQAVHDAVVAHLAGIRAGTASTLSKGEVSGSNKKPWRQKGTGRARAGLRQSPVWRGGAVAFGPHPRSYEQKVNRKVARLAYRRALSEKVAEGRIRVVEEIALGEPKTRLFAAFLRALSVKGPALVVVDKVEASVARAARNVENVEVARGCDVSVYQLLRYRDIVASRRGLEQMTARLSEGGSEESPK
jgi:large subunit ribosomal protein L4